MTDATPPLRDREIETLRKARAHVDGIVTLAEMAKERLWNGRFEYAPPKPATGRHDVEFRAKAVAALKCHQTRQLEERGKLGGVTLGSGLVFATTTGTPVRRQNLHRHFKPLLKEAGLPDVRFHDLRRTFATLTLAYGAGLNTLSKILRHASVKTTLDIYAHIIPGMQQRALSALDGLSS